MLCLDWDRDGKGKKKITDRREKENVKWDCLN